MTNDADTSAPERIWMDPDIRFPECEKQYGCDVGYIRADLYDAATAERDALRASRVGYASEFPPDENGEPDVGNIHSNIRILKGRVAALEAERDNLSDKLNLERALTDGAHRRARTSENDRERLHELCKRLVNLVEGLDGYGIARSAMNGERLKDETPWVAFYNEVKRLDRAAITPEADT